jgi:hypothetical protein
MVLGKHIDVIVGSDLHEDLRGVVMATSLAE